MGRTHQRFKPANKFDWEVEIGNTKYPAIIVDISEGGAFANIPYFSETDDVLKKIHETGITLSNKQVPEFRKKCEILPNRKGIDFGRALLFKEKMANHDLSKVVRIPVDGITPEDANLLKLGWEDYKTVISEIEMIKNCRSSLFNNSITAVTTCLIAGIGWWIISGRNDNYWVVMLGMITSYLWVVVSVFGSIEKSRAIHMRIGFIIILSAHLRKGFIPSNYLGWAQYRVNRGECRSRSDAELCCANKTTCWKEIKNCFHEFPQLETRDLVSKPLSSFTSFSSIVYGILYLITTISVISSFLRTCYGKSPVATVWISFILGIFSFAIAICLIKELKKIRKEEHSPEIHSAIWQLAFVHCKPTTYRKA